MTTRELLTRIKAMLEAAFGPRLRGVVLYGSEARGQAGPDSDIDVLALLTGPVDHWQDSWTCIDALYPLVLELDGRPIDAKPVEVEEYERGGVPLYGEAKREGIVA
jgi:predicted nucleotidyltransferase